MTDLAIGKTRSLFAAGRWRFTLPGSRRTQRILSAVCLVYLVALIALCVINNFVPIVPTTQNLSLRLVPPFSALQYGPQYILGGDQLGRPVLGMLLEGGKVSLSVGFGSALLAFVVGVPLGLLAGSIGGVVESVILRVVDFWMSLPVLLMALVVLFTFGGGVLNLVLVLGLLRWVIFARVTRALTLSIKNGLFITAARAVGCSPARILFGYILRNIRWELLSLFTLEAARSMLAEAALSFLGLGVQPPNSSWGSMLSAAQPYLGTSAWLTFLPGFAILLTALSLSLIVGAMRATESSEALTWRQLK